jgi:hypothetical protein
VTDRQVAGLQPRQIDLLAEQALHDVAPGLWRDAHRCYPEHQCRLLSPDLIARIARLPHLLKRLGGPGGEATSSAWDHPQLAGCARSGK